LLFGETSGDIYGRQKEIPGIIYKSKGRKFLQPLSHKNRNAYLIVLRRIAPFFPFEPYFFSASFPSTKVIRKGRLVFHKWLAALLFHQVRYIVLHPGSLSLQDEELFFS
jgi:hypothetical protein